MRSLLALCKALFIAALAGAVCAANAAAQAKPLAGANVPVIYERLLKKIDQIPLYDNHSHATFPDDSDMDAQAAPPDESAVLRLRDDNPEFVAAAKSLFGYPYEDFKPEHAKWLIDKKKAAEAAGGTTYWDSILDKLNIETCLANRVALAGLGDRGPPCRRNRIDACRRCRYPASAWSDLAGTFGAVVEGCPS